jgi:hypothetical protein
MSQNHTPLEAVIADLDAADPLAGLDLSGLLGDEPPAAEWSKPNEHRSSIAEQVGVPVATWTTRTRSTKVIARDARRLERAVEAVDRLPEPGEYLHFVVGGEFRGFDLLPAMLRLAKSERFDALTLTTLGFSRENLEDVGKMVVAGTIPPGDLRILASDFFRRADREIWQFGSDLARSLGFGFRSSRNHTKLTLACIAGKAYVVESSANLRSCANLEQFTMTQSRELYDFHAGWIEQIWQTSEE